METENEYEYIYRVCQNKELIGTWQQVADLINQETGNDYGESTYRKQFAAFQKMFVNNMERIVGDKHAEAIDEKIGNLQKERYKIQAAKLEISRALRQESRFELFYESIRDAIERLPMPELRVPDGVGGYDSLDRLLYFGDIHYGATFTSINNTYSRAICAERFERLLDETAKYIQANSVTNLKVLNVGDTIQGILRYTDLQINDIPVVECVVEISRLLANFLNQLASFATIEYYHVPAANHTQIRPLGSKANEIATEDLERLIVNYVSDLLAGNPRVQVISNVGRDFIEFQVGGFNAISIHGHQVKSISGSLVKDLSNRHHRLYDFVFCGHKHVTSEIPAGEADHHNMKVFICPSFVGSDPYADSLMAGNKAAARLLTFDTVYGHTDSHEIILN